MDLNVECVCTYPMKHTESKAETQWRKDVHTIECMITHQMKDTEYHMKHIGYKLKHNKDKMEALSNVRVRIRWKTVNQMKDTEYHMKHTEYKLKHNKGKMHTLSNVWDI